jgi:hypothetical protein
LVEHVELYHRYFTTPPFSNRTEANPDDETDSYPNVAASAIAAFLIPSFIMAAALAHLGVLMFDNMSTTWAMATIGFISFGLCALIYFIFFFGAKIRERSKLTRTF